MKQLATKILPVLLLLTVTTAVVGAHDYVPGAPQTVPVLLKGGDLYTVSNGVRPATDLLFENGRITQIGQDLDLPPNTEVIDVAGMRVYPGLIDANSTLGLIEIGEVRATDDLAEVGLFTPEVAAHIAYNPDSELLPTVRAEGVTTSLIVPRGGMIRGRSALMNLDGWTKEDAGERLVAALHVSWPRQSIVKAWWMDKTPKEQRKENSEMRDQLYEAFRKARAYYTAVKADSTIPVDTRWHAMIPVFDRNMPVIIHAPSVQQIEQAVAFGDEFRLRIIISQGNEAYRCTDLLSRKNIPVILNPPHKMPLRNDDDFDITFKLPRLLRDADIPFCIGSSSASGSRNLCLQAGQAAAYGLTQDEALRAITLSPAEILGVADDLGSLDVGKKATLFVSEGDVMDFDGHTVTLMFIEGRAVDLNSKHKELYNKYRQKHTAVDDTSE